MKNFWRDLTLAIIGRMQKQKQDQNIFPYHVNKAEIVNYIATEAKSVLDQMEEDNLIHSHDTVHGKAYTLKQ